MNRKTRKKARGICPEPIWKDKKKDATIADPDADIGFIHSGNGITPAIRVGSILLPASLVLNRGLYGRFAD